MLHVQLVCVIDYLCILCRYTCACTQDDNVCVCVYIYTHALMHAYCLLNNVFIVCLDEIQLLSINASV